MVFKIATGVLLFILAITVVTFIKETIYPPHDMTFLGLLDSVLLFYAAPVVLPIWLVCVFKRVFG